MKMQTQIPVSSYKADGFIAKYQNLIQDTIIPYMQTSYWNNGDCTEMNWITVNFINAAKALRGEESEGDFYGSSIYEDSEAYKWLEIVAISLANKADSTLEKQADQLIDLIAAAQDEDGYLNTYFTIKDRDKRWTNLLEGYELYCSGYMIEAACTYFEVTGKRKFLDVAVKNAECIYKQFATRGIEDILGDSEIESALMKLYRLTGNSHFLELSKIFIDERVAYPPSDLRLNATKKRVWTLYLSNLWNDNYHRSGKPVRQQPKATGNVVRTVNLYTGVADFASETENEELFEDCRSLWDDIVRKKMYITGGISSTDKSKEFTVDYDLSPDTACSNTCSSIGLMSFGSKMLEKELKGEYADVIELAFYNIVLAGMQLDGKAFSCSNPLAVTPGISGRIGPHSHVFTVRSGLYVCECCLFNTARLIGSIDKYAYGENDDTAYCHLFASGGVSFKNGITLQCQTDYPYDMTVKYTVKGSGRLAVRIPKWSKRYTLKLDGSEITALPHNGYVYMEIINKAEIELVLDGTPRFIRASCKVPWLTGMTALMRGPLVYCFEGSDNESVRDLRLDRSVVPAVSEFEPNLLGGTVRLTAKAYRISDCEDIYSSEPEKLTPCEAVAVPYYTWGNRGENEMRVWMNTV